MKAGISYFQYLFMLCACNFHSDIFTLQPLLVTRTPWRYVPHAVLNIFAKFQSQVGKILITAININGPGLAPHSDAAARSRHKPDFLCDHDTLIIFRQSQL